MGVAMCPLWDNRPMLQLNPADTLDLTFALKKAVKQSGITLADITGQLDRQYGVQVSISSLSRSINRGTIRFQLAVQVLAICGVTEVAIKPTK